MGGASPDADISTAISLQESFGHLFRRSSRVLATHGRTGIVLQALVVLLFLRRLGLRHGLRHRFALCLGLALRGLGGFYPLQELFRAELTPELIDLVPLFLA